METCVGTSYKGFEKWDRAVPRIQCNLATGVETLQKSPWNSTLLGPKLTICSPSHSDSLMNHSLTSHNFQFIDDVLSPPFERVWFSYFISDNSVVVRPAGVEDFSCQAQVLQLSLLSICPLQHAREVKNWFPCKKSKYLLKCVLSNKLSCDCPKDHFFRKLIVSYVCWYTLVLGMVPDGLWKMYKWSPKLWSDNLHYNRTMESEYRARKSDNQICAISLQVKFARTSYLEIR